MSVLWSRAPSALACFALLTACAGHSAMPPASSTQSQNASHKKVIQSGGTTLTLTPNFNTGFGPVSSIVAGGLNPAPGPNATLDGGNIDFGTVSPGVDYYYRYAIELGITTSSSYQLTASISGAIAPGVPANMLNWLTSNSANYNNNETAAYGGLPFGSTNAPLIIASGSSGTTTLKYDYILMVPNVQESSPSTAQIQYSVIP